MEPSTSLENCFLSEFPALHLSKPLDGTVGHLVCSGFTADCFVHRAHFPTSQAGVMFTVHRSSISHLCGQPDGITAGQ